MLFISIQSNSNSFFSQTIRRKLTDLCLVSTVCMCVILIKGTSRMGFEKCMLFFYKGREDRGGKRKKTSCQKDRNRKTVQLTLGAVTSSQIQEVQTCTHTHTYKQKCIYCYVCLHKHPPFDHCLPCIHIHICYSTHTHTPDVITTGNAVTSTMNTFPFLG